MKKGARRNGGDPGWDDAGALVAIEASETDEAALMYSI